MKKFILIKTYLSHYKALLKKIRVILLTKKRNSFFITSFNYIWACQGVDIISGSNESNIDTYKIFGVSIDINRINWHKDYLSSYEYPLKRFDKIKIKKRFNQGIDVKYTWEVSRFYFAIKLAQQFHYSKNNKYYYKFKALIIDWIEKNSFCFGVNWYCTMEVAIRAINWIVSINLFKDVILKDKEFKQIIKMALVQHAEYISTFPEIYGNGRTTNHTTADFTGLLFLALTLRSHPDSKKWLSQAINGLEKCIKYQTYNDGANFEASIPYHRLVLEMFAYSEIVAKANGVEFSKRYYGLLFKMFEYTAAYVDHSGNAPQVGDNDSGRILIFHESDEHDHTYLLNLGEHIFDYKFRSQCKKRHKEFKQWLPEINKINIEKLGIEKRITDTSLSFENGRAYFLKNNMFSLMVNCFPLGMNGSGGHNHLDIGSFTLSIKGAPIVVDPGTFTYSANLKERRKLRNYLHHNVLFKLEDKNITLEKNGIWGLKQKYFESKLIYFDGKILEIEVKNLMNRYLFNRRFELVDKNTINITEKCIGAFFSILHLSPNVQINYDKLKTIIVQNDIIIEAKESLMIDIEKYDYSNNYGSKCVAMAIKMSCIDSNSYSISYNTN